MKRGLVSVDTLDGSDAPQHVARHGADVLFDGAHDQERWDLRWRQGEIEIMGAIWTGPEEGADPGATDGPTGRRPDNYVVLTISKNGRTQPMALSTVPRDGDRASIAVFRRGRMPHWPR